MGTGVQDKKGNQKIEPTGKNLKKTSLRGEGRE